jgi:hypothetical protein
MDFYSQLDVEKLKETDFVRIKFDPTNLGLEGICPSQYPISGTIQAINVDHLPWHNGYKRYFDNWIIIFTDGRECEVSGDYYYDRNVRDYDFDHKDLIGKYIDLVLFKRETCFDLQMIDDGANAGCIATANHIDHIEVDISLGG